MNEPKQQPNDAELVGAFIDRFLNVRANQLTGYVLLTFGCGPGERPMHCVSNVGQLDIVSVVKFFLEQSERKIHTPAQ